MATNVYARLIAILDNAEVSQRNYWWYDMIDGFKAGVDDKLNQNDLEVWFHSFCDNEVCTLLKSQPESTYSKK